MSGFDFADLQVKFGQLLQDVAAAGGGDDFEVPLRVFRDGLSTATGGDLSHLQSTNVQDTLELAFRKAMLATASSAADAADAAGTLLDCAIWACSASYLAPQVPFVLLDDMAESRLVEECTAVFDLVRQRVQRLTQPDLFTLKSKLALLSLCNNMLRRLSRTTHREFCGQILMLLADILPLDERSGVNVAGAFNAENVTSFEEEFDEDTGAAVDTRLYKAVWSVQNILSSPDQLSDPAAFDTFVKHLDRFLQALESTPLSERTLSAPGGIDFTTGSSPKYLTGSRLLHLQLKDPQFRHDVLTQCIFIFDYLCNVEKPAFLLEKQAQLPEQKQKQTQKQKQRVATKPNFKRTVHLTPDQTEQIAELQKRASTLMRQVPGIGPFVQESVRRLVNRERNWVWWKNDVPKACPEIRRPAMDASRLAEPLRPSASPSSSFSSSSSSSSSASASLRHFSSLSMQMQGGRHPAKRPPMGSEDLARLWDQPDVFQEDYRNFCPPLEQFYSLLEADENPELADDVDYIKNSASEKFVWRALRRMAAADYDNFAVSKGALDTMSQSFAMKWKAKLEPAVAASPLARSPAPSPSPAHQDTGMSSAGDDDHDDHDHDHGDGDGDGDGGGADADDDGDEAMTTEAGGGIEDDEGEDAEEEEEEEEDEARGRQKQQSTTLGPRTRKRKRQKEDESEESNEAALENEQDPKDTEDGGDEQDVAGERVVEDEEGGKPVEEEEAGQDKSSAEDGESKPPSRKKARV